MIKLFAKSEEKLVKGVMLYADSSNNLCFDVDATEKVDGTVVENLFNKGFLHVVTSDGVYIPTVLKKGTKGVQVSLVVMGASAAEALAFVSGDYEA